MGIISIFRSKAWQTLLHVSLLYSFQSAQKSDAPVEKDAPAAATDPQVNLDFCTFRFFF
jgi:hypothetical protein